MFSPYYQDFGEILGTRDVISLQHIREVGVTKKIYNSKTNNEDTVGNKCVFLNYSCLSIKRTPFLCTGKCFPNKRKQGEQLFCAVHLP